MKKNTLVMIIMLLIETVIVCALAVSGSRAREDIHFDSQSLIISESAAETPVTSLDRGIYQVCVQYQGNEDHSWKMDVSRPDGLSEYVHAIESDEITLPSYTNEVSENVYINQHDCQTVISLTTDGTANAGDITGISIYYLRARSVLFRCMTWIFIFMVLDSVVWIFASGWWSRISVENRKVICGILGIIFLVNMPLYTDYLTSGHDLGFHLLRIGNIAEGLLNKTFPVRIQPSWVNGAGYATGVCYGDAFLYLPAVLKMIGFPLRWAYKCYLFIINSLTAVLAWYSFYRMSRDKMTGLICSLAYSLSIWHLVDVYTRAAVGEYSAMAFIPLVLLGIWELEEGQKYAYLVLALGVSGIIETHVLSVLMIGEFGLIYCIVRWRSFLKKDRFLALGKAILLSVMLCAGFLVPFLDYYVNVPLAIKKADYAIQGEGIYLSQLFMTGFTTTASSQKYIAGIGKDMPLTIGLGLLLTIGIEIGRLLTDKVRSRNKTILILILTMMSLFMSSVYMPYDWIKLNIPSIYGIFEALQFAWRYLTVAMALSAVLLMLLLIDFQSESRKKMLLCGGVIGAVIIWQSMTFMSDYMNQSGIYTANDTAMIDPFYMVGEYLPLGTDTAVYRNNSVRNENQDVQIGQTEYEHGEYTVDVSNTARAERTIDLPLIYYKGYQVDSDQGILQIEAGENNMIEVHIPAGYDGRISAMFIEPWYWRCSELISALTVAGLMIWGIQSVRVRREKTGADGGFTGGNDAKN